MDTRQPTRRRSARARMGARQDSDEGRCAPDHVDGMGESAAFFCPFRSTPYGRGPAGRTGDRTVNALPIVVPRTPRSPGGRRALAASPTGRRLAQGVGEGDQVRLSQGVLGKLVEPSGGLTAPGQAEQGPRWAARRWKRLGRRNRWGGRYPPKPKSKPAREKLPRRRRSVWRSATISGPCVEAFSSRG